jgi:hypothetical protein
VTELHLVRVHGGYRPSLEINGHEVHATRATINFDPGCLPSLTVELPVTQTDVDVTAVIRLSDPTIKALETLGWTPPDTTTGDTP